MLLARTHRLPVSCHLAVLAALLSTVLLTCAPAAHAVDGPWKYLKQPQSWFGTGESKRVIDNLLTYQTPLGGWPKNVDTTAAPFTGRVEELAPTFDNRATTDELRLVARMFNATGDERCRKAFAAGLDYILVAQYPTGGWPQSYPIRATTYHRHITFNDDAMTRVVTFLHEVITQPEYAFMDDGQKQKTRASFDRAIACILKCQIRVNSQLTGWCAQHDEIDLSPRKGRWHELPSVGSAESLSIVRLLMSLEHPSSEVIQSVDAAVAWFERSRIKGWRIVQHPEEKEPGRFRDAVRDSSAPDLWARMYDLETNQPLVAGMDSVPHLGMDQTGFGRPGYQWFGSWPEPMLKKEHPAWKKNLPR